MCKTNFTVVVFYDGTRSAKEVLNDAITSKVRRKMLLFTVFQIIQEACFFLGFLLLCMDNIIFCMDTDKRDRIIKRIKPDEYSFVLELNQRYVDVRIPMDREELEAGEFVVIGD